MDIYLEYMVKKKKGAKETLYIILTLISVLLIFFYVTPIVMAIVPNFTFLAAAVIVGAVYVAYYIITSLNIEYEYILTNDEVDIDKITARRKRKRIVNFTIDDIEIIAPANKGDYIKPYSACKIIDASSCKTASNCYFTVFTKNSERICLIFEPSDAIIRSLKKQAPSKVIIDESI